MKIIVKKHEMTIAERIDTITKKCVELSARFASFSWEFSQYSGIMYFTACFRDGEEWVFPMHDVNVDRCYKLILNELDMMKWSTMEWVKEEHE